MSRRCGKVRKFSPRARALTYFPRFFLLEQLTQQLFFDQVLFRESYSIKVRILDRLMAGRAVEPIRLTSLNLFASKIFAHPLRSARQTFLSLCLSLIRAVLGSDLSQRARRLEPRPICEFC